MFEPKEAAISELREARAALIAVDAALAAARVTIQNSEPLPSDAIDQIKAIDVERLELSKRIVENRNLYIQAKEAAPDIARLKEELKRAREGAEADAKRVRQATTNAGKVVDVLEKAAEKAPQLHKQIADALDKVEGVFK